MFSSKAAVIGTGFIGPVHVEALLRAGVEVVGICGSTAEKSERAARLLGLAKGYADLSAVLADRSVDVVHVASPNHLHFEQTRAVLAAGKHVLCEKPLAMTSKQTRELVRLASESGKIAAVCYNVRYYPLCIEAAQRVRGGGLGDLFHATGSYVQDWLHRESDFNWRVTSEHGGELRAVADIGTHWMDLIQHISGRKVVAVCADLQTVHPRRRVPSGGALTFAKGGNPDRQNEPGKAESVEVDTEDFGMVMLRFAGELRGSVHVSQVTAGRKNCLRFELAGSRTSLAWNSEVPNELFVGHRDQPNEMLIRDPALMSSQAAATASYPGGHNEGFPDTFKQLFRDVYQSIEAGLTEHGPTYPTFEDGHHEVKLCEAILRSHRRRTWIDLENNA